VKTFLLIYTFVLANGATIEADGEMLRTQNFQQCDRISVERESVLAGEIHHGEHSLFIDVHVTCQELRGKNTKD
jgi:hypothetical protein